MGKRKAKTVAQSLLAKVRMQAYWDRKKGKTVEEPQPSTSGEENFNNAGEGNDDNALVAISIGRLKELLNGKKCNVCGEVAETTITKEYFDCVIEVQCNKCSLLMCHSEPRKTESNKVTEGNSKLLDHCISEGYGRAGLSRLSALFGTHTITQSAFKNYAEYLDSATTQNNNDKQKNVLKTVHEHHIRQENINESDEIKVGVGHDGTSLAQCLGPPRPNLATLEDGREMNNIRRLRSTKNPVTKKNTEKDAKIPEGLCIKEEPHDPSVEWLDIKEESLEYSAEADEACEWQFSPSLLLPSKQESVQSKSQVMKASRNSLSKTYPCKETNSDDCPDDQIKREDIEDNTSTLLPPIEQVFVEDFPISEAERTFT